MEYWKSTGLDGIRSWIINKAVEGFLEFLLEFYDKCWEKDAREQVDRRRVLERRDHYT